MRRSGLYFLHLTARQVAACVPQRHTTRSIVPLQANHTCKNMCIESWKVMHPGRAGSCRMAAWFDHRISTIGVKNRPDCHSSFCRCSTAVATHFPLSLPSPAVTPSDNNGSAVCAALTAVSRGSTPPERIQWVVVRASSSTVKPDGCVVPSAVSSHGLTSTKVGWGGSLGCQKPLSDEMEATCAGCSSGCAALRSEESCTSNRAMMAAGRREGSSESFTVGAGRQGHRYRGRGAGIATKG